MSVQLSTLINEVMPDVIGVPYPLVEMELRKILVDFCHKTFIINEGFKKDVLSTDPASPNNHIDIATPAAYAEYMPCHIMRLTIDGVDYDTEERKITSDLTDINSIVDSTETKLWYASTATNIIMYPFEAIAAQLYLKVAFKPTMSITSLDDLFYQDYHDDIVAGTKANLMVMPKKSWTDMQSAANYRSDYIKGRNSALITIINSIEKEVKQRANSKSFL